MLQPSMSLAMTRERSLLWLLRIRPFDQILKELASRYGFRIKGVQNVGVGELLSQKMSGRLDEVVGRLLRNWNHMVVRSPDSPCGIEAVMILNKNYGTGPAKPTQMPVDEADLLKGARFAF